MSKPKHYDKSFVVRLTAATLAQIRAAMKRGETMGAFVRAAIEDELQRRRPGPEHADD
jgi:hypothetical protein